MNVSKFQYIQLHEVVMQICDQSILTLFFINGLKCPGLILVCIAIILEHSSIDQSDSPLAYPSVDRYKPQLVRSSMDRSSPHLVDHSTQFLVHSLNDHPTHIDPVCLYSALPMLHTSGPFSMDKKSSLPQWIDSTQT